MRVDTPAVATHLMANTQQFLTPVGSFLRRSAQLAPRHTGERLQGLSFPVKGKQCSLLYDIPCYSTRSYDIIWYSTIFHNILWSSMIFRDVLRYCTIFHTIFHNIMRYCIWYSMQNIQRYSAIFYDILRYSAIFCYILYYITLYYIIFCSLCPGGTEGLTVWSGTKKIGTEIYEIIIIYEMLGNFSCQINFELSTIR